MMEVDIMLKEYKCGNVIIRINNECLHVAYCANCNNQLNYINFGGYDYCKSKNFNCKKCDSPCTGLNGQYETGYYERIIYGYCKKCNAKIEY